MTQIKFCQLWSNISEWSISIFSFKIILVWRQETEKSNISCVVFSFQHKKYNKLSHHLHFSRDFQFLVIHDTLDSIFDIFYLILYCWQQQSVGKFLSQMQRVQIYEVMRILSLVFSGQEWTPLPPASQTMYAVLHFGRKVWLLLNKLDGQFLFYFAGSDSI